MAALRDATSPGDVTQIIAHQMLKHPPIPVTREPEVSEVRWRYSPVSQSLRRSDLDTL